MIRSREHLRELCHACAASVLGCLLCAASVSTLPAGAARAAEPTRTAERERAGEQTQGGGQAESADKARNAAPALTEAEREAAVRRWVERWGGKWWERYHPEYVAEYPGGRSNIYHDQYIQKAMKRLEETATGDWKITGKSYLYDGDWFAVEWFFESTQTATGRVQKESTLAFGRIEDDRLIEWIEYFDDMVGWYQMIGAMRLPAEGEPVFPWPADTALSREYRP